MDVLQQEELDAVLRGFQSRMRAHFGARIREMRLFGSYVRGTARPHSDIDVLVVLEPFQRTDDDKNAVAEIMSDLCIEHGVLIMPVFVSEDDFHSNNLAFFRNVRQESVAV